MNDDFWIELARRKVQTNFALDKPLGLPLPTREDAERRYVDELTRNPDPRDRYSQLQGALSEKEQNISRLRHEIQLMEASVDPPGREAALRAELADCKRLIHDMALRLEPRNPVPVPQTMPVNVQLNGLMNTRLPQMGQLPVTSPYPQYPVVNHYSPMTQPVPHVSGPSVSIPATQPVAHVSVPATQPVPHVSVPATQPVPHVSGSTVSTTQPVTQAASSQQTSSVPLPAEAKSSHKPLVHLQVITPAVVPQCSGQPLSTPLPGPVGSALTSYAVQSTTLPAGGSYTIQPAATEGPYNIQPATVTGGSIGVQNVGPAYSSLINNTSNYGVSTPLTYIPAAASPLPCVPSTPTYKTRSANASSASLLIQARPVSPCAVSPPRVSLTQQAAVPASTAPIYSYQQVAGNHVTIPVRGVIPGSTHLPATISRSSSMNYPTMTVPGTYR